MAVQSKPVPVPVRAVPVPIGPWGRATAGAAGAVFANALVYPLDLSVARCKQQTLLFRDLPFMRAVADAPFRNRIKTKLQVQVKRKHGPPSTTKRAEAEAAAEAEAEAEAEAQVEDDGEPHYGSTWDAMRQITAAEGLAGLYAGMMGSLLGVASTNFAYFYWYSVVRTLYLRYSRTASPPSTAVELSLGAGAGALAQLFTIPVAVITTRQQTQRKEARQGIVATAQEIIGGEDGVFGLWSGLKASLVLVVNPAITYGAYERLKRSLFPARNSLKPWEAFALGAMSKALATILTQPLIVAKVGLQSKPPPARNGKKFQSFIEVMQFIVENEGLRSLFKGMGPQILKGLLVQGILMMTKERVEIIFILFIRYLQQLRSKQLARVAEMADTVKGALPITSK